MNKINELNLQIKQLEEIREKEKRGEISALKAVRYREAVRDKIINIIETEEYVLGK